MSSYRIVQGMRGFTHRGGLVRVFRSACCTKAKRDSWEEGDLQSDPTTPAAPPPRLFLIDDDADSRELFAEFLRLEGFAVVDYENAEDALASLEHDRPALIVTDVT